MTTTTAPGVYIEEDAFPAISVSQGATAVPLFIGGFVNKNAKDIGMITRVSSWLDFCQKFNDDIALQLYFQNGGGECYIYPFANDTGSSLNALFAQNDDASDADLSALPIQNDDASDADLSALPIQNDDASDTDLSALPVQNDDASDTDLSTLPAMIDEVGDITLLVVSENDFDYKKKVYAALTTLLEQKKGYFLLADSENGSDVSGLGASAHVAMYYPSLIPVSKPSETVSASAVIAGVYCRTDRERGVWKAPANVVLSGVNDVSVRVTNDAQGVMNTAGVNVIRYFTGRGVTVWGARTMKPDDNNWRYIPVRRLFDAAERDIKKAIRPMVFEPNNALTWKRVKIAIENYLHAIWLQGGLAGDKAEEAYLVKIGKNITMTTDDINQGKMVVQVSMAAVRPAEFITLQFTQNMS